MESQLNQIYTKSMNFLISNKSRNIWKRKKEGTQKNANIGNVKYEVAIA